jgi:hypothetical protein
LRLTIDSSERLDDVLQAVGGLFGVRVEVAAGSRPSKSTTRGRRTRVTRGAKAATTSRRTTGRRPARKAAGRASGAADIRAWARANGQQIADRGRIPSDVVSAYRAAQG